MKNYQKLKQTIQEANPEIMELKFGCELLNIDDEGIWRVFKIGEVNISNNKIKFYDDYFEITKILGRPIRLADVLLAWKRYYQNWLNEVQSVAPSGKSSFEKLDYNEIAKNWSLEDDNLDNQSSETKKFLIDLLTR